MRRFLNGYTQLLATILAVSYLSAFAFFRHWDAFKSLFR